MEVGRRIARIFYYYTLIVVVSELARIKCTHEGNAAICCLNNKQTMKFVKTLSCKSGNLLNAL